MKTIKAKDQEFLQALGGRVRSGKQWKVFFRKGDVLLLMPAAPCAIRAGARLYSPQRILAKLATAAILRGPFWRLLPGCHWDWIPGSPLDELMKLAGVPVGAVLLGNASQEGRRALILTDEDEPRVLKLGVGPVASQLVSSERDFLQAGSRDSELIPEPLLQAGGDDWEAFGISYFEDGEDLGVDELAGVLRGWLDSEPRPMSELPGWQRICASGRPEAASLANECCNLRLRPSRVHGDLAPWNVRRKSDGGMVLIDWEEGRENDVPCWDALHFCFQRAALVKRLDSEAIRAELFRLMAEGELATLIKDSGWAGHEELLFSTYLIAMATEDSHVSTLLGARGRRKKNG